MIKFHTAYQDTQTQKYLVKFVYKPIKFVLNRMWKVLKEPTIEEARFSNTLTLLEIRDWFLAHESNLMYQDFWKSVLNLGIMKQDDDFYYKIRLEKILRKWLELYNAGKWEWTPDEKGVAWWK